MVPPHERCRVHLHPGSHRASGGTATVLPGTIKLAVTSLLMTSITSLTLVLKLNVPVGAGHGRGGWGMRDRPHGPFTDGYGRV